MRSASEQTIARLSPADLPPGEILPPQQPDHPSWRLLSGWQDPFATGNRASVRSGKTRVEASGLPALEWLAGANAERALITGEATWRDIRLQCRVQAVQEWDGPAHDGRDFREALAGLVFRMETVRRHYWFGVEGARRLVLYRRMDDEWFVLGACPIACGREPLTLRVEACGDGIRAACPEADVEFQATDTLVREGRAGFRARGRCLLYALEVAMTPPERARNARRAAALALRTDRLGERIPDAVAAGEISLPEGGRLLACEDFHTPGRNDLLIASPEGLTARTWEGRTLWHVPLEAASAEAVVAPRTGDPSRRIYALAGGRRLERELPDWASDSALLATEILALDGASGSVAARAPLPEHRHLARFLRWDFAARTGRLFGPEPFDLVIRPWQMDLENGGRDLWAFDADLHMRWHRWVHPPYGHHDAVRLLDVNGDGRDEVIAGGTVLSARGEVVARHDRAEEVWSTRSATHYDAVWAAHTADEPDGGPRLFLLAGSAGVYVVEAATGRTLANHRVGHAQWGATCCLRGPAPDEGAGAEQVLVGTRWGNYGILTLFSGRGERLWTIQPDFIAEGSRAVQWLAEGPQHLWVNTSEEAMGLYDGCGRMVKRLEAVRSLWRKDPSVQRRCTALARRPGGRHRLVVPIHRTLHVFAPADDAPG